MGKSELLNQIAAHLVGVHEWKVLLAKPEEANVKTAKLLAGKIAHASSTTPRLYLMRGCMRRLAGYCLGIRCVCSTYTNTWAGSH